MNRIRALVLSCTTAALLAGGLVSPGVAWADAPSTIPSITSPADGANLTGTVTVTVASTAPRVQLHTLGPGFLGIADVVSGVATFSWKTWGVSGSISLKASDCDAADVCAYDGDVVVVNVTHDKPVIVAPIEGATVSGEKPLVVTLTMPGGAGAVMVDWITRGYAHGPDYTVTIPADTLTEGPHTLLVDSCDEAVTFCNGERSEPVSFTVGTLHPSITSQSPNPFSPNANGIKDTTTTTYVTTGSDTVTWTALDASDAVVLGPIALGTPSAGTHTYLWDGKDSGGVTVPDGTYTIRIDTANGGFTGHATTTVVVDSTLPTMTAVVGAGLGFYPYPDGYKDTYTPTVLLSETATLTLTVRTSTNALVRRVAATRSAGRVGVAWNGRNTAGALVPAGTYRWTLTAIDAAGNARVTPVYTVIVSAKKLVAKTVYVTMLPSKRIATKRSATCAAVRTSTYGSTGAWFYNNCDIRRTGQEWVEGWYSTALPYAVSYSKVTVQVFGHTHSHGGYAPLARTYAWIDRVGGATWVSRSYDFRYSTARWVSIVSAPGAGFVSTTRRVAFGFGVGNYWYPAPNEVDVRYLRLAVVMKVLV